MKPILRLLVISFVMLVVFAGCCCKKCDNTTVSVTQREAPYSGINVKIPAGKTLADLTAEIYTKLNIRIDEKVHVRTCPCDTTLVNINYPGLDFWGQGPRIPSKPTPNGYGDTLDLPGFVAGKNYDISFDEKDSIGKQDDYNPNGKYDIGSQFRTLATFSNSSTAVGTVTVAIFDSGLDDNFLMSGYVGVNYDFPACFSDDALAKLKSRETMKNGIVKGLNLAPADFPSNQYDIANISDTHPGRHGSNVASLVVQQFKETPHTKALKLLIMRVLNNQNKGDAFGIMCAMYHAKQMGADVYNMSLGYYGREDLIFKQYVESIRGTGAKPGWLVAASGNAMPLYDLPGIPVDDPKNRNLGERSDSSKLYPAYFSKSMTHVISVNTVLGDTSGICLGQNYDPKSLDLGVRTPNCAFIVRNSQNLWGTSYATPTATGWIAAQPNLLVNKADLLRPAPADRRLEAFVRSGKFIQLMAPR